MPNQRDPDQQFIAVWVPSQVKKDLQAAARAEGISFPAYMRQIIEKAIAESKRKPKK